MSKLSRKLPTKPGWYWFKQKTSGLRIVCLNQWEDGSLHFSQSFHPSSIREWPGRWAGPITEPT